MKKIKLLLIICCLLLVKLCLCQVITVSGYVYLQNQSNYSNIKVLFQRVAPSSLLDSTYTDSIGYFNKNIQTGYYNLIFSKDNYMTITMLNIPLYSNTIIQDTILVTNGLSGNLSGDLPSGTYVVYDNITVALNTSLKINPGTKFLFKSGKYFSINGHIDCQGTVSDSIIFTKFNDTTKWNGIIFNQNNTPNSILKYCLIEYSHSAGLNIYSSTPPVLSHLTVRNNGYWMGPAAGGICIDYCYNATAYLDNIILYNNYGYHSGGMDIVTSSAVINNALIYNNAGYYGFSGIYFSGNKLELTNSILRNNSGAALLICNNNSSTISKLVNVTIANNTTGGIDICGKINITNCIIYNNGGWGINNNSSNPIPSVLYSNIYSNSGGNFINCGSILGNIVTTNSNGTPCDGYFNIGMSPDFVDTINGNFELLPSSHCIDAGVNDSVTFLTDIVGNYRIWDGNNDGSAIVDIGAHEFGSPLDTITNVYVQKDLNSDLIIYPIPTFDKLNFICDNDIFLIEVYNLSGQKIFRKEFNNNISAINQFDISEFKQGVYILKAQSLNNFYVKKVIKN